VLYASREAAKAAKKAEKKVEEANRPKPKKRLRKAVDNPGACDASAIDLDGSAAIDIS